MGCVKPKGEGKGGGRRMAHTQVYPEWPFVPEGHGCVTLSSTGRWKESPLLPLSCLLPRPLALSGDRMLGVQMKSTLHVYNSEENNLLTVNGAPLRPKPRDRHELSPSWWCGQRTNREVLFLFILLQRKPRWQGWGSTGLWEVSDIPVNAQKIPQALAWFIVWQSLWGLLLWRLN